MKLLPSHVWQRSTSLDPTSAHIRRSQLGDQPTTFLSSFWRSFVVGNPTTKRSSYLEKRKDKTETVTETEQITNTVFSTIFINQTITSHLLTTIWSTRDITHTQSITFTHNMTMTTSIPASEPTNLSASKTVHLSPTKAEVSETAAPSATPVVAPKHHLSTLATVGIVFGVLALLGLLVAVLFLVRRFYRMYRRERVLRKQLQTEGNELPVMKTGDDAGVGHKEFGG